MSDDNENSRDGGDAAGAANRPVRRRSLGRGLEALLGGPGQASAENTPAPAVDTPPDVPRTQPSPAAVTPPASGPERLPTGKIIAGKYQPRRYFSDTELNALTESVREKGILQPILVRPHPDQPGFYELVAGERRWRAAQRAQLHEVPALVLELSDRDTLEVALVENVQRQDLSPIEEAQGYQRLMDEFGHSQDELAKMIGKSRSHVANTIRLLGLPDGVKRMVEEGSISAGHARALIGAADPLGLARQVEARGLSVRETERMAMATKRPGEPPRHAAGRDKNAPPEKDTDTLALEAELENLLGLKVDIRHAGERGQIIVHYQSLEQFDDLLERLGRK